MSPQTVAGKRLAEEIYTVPRIHGDYAQDIDAIEAEARVMFAEERRAKRRNRITCICGHAFSSHRQDPVDPWVSERCKTCGCASFDYGRRPSGWDDEA